MLTERDFYEMRRLVTAYYPDTIVLSSVSTVYDENGAETRTRTTVATVLGQLSAARGSEIQHVTEILSSAIVNQGTENIEIMHLALPYETAVSVEYEVTTVDGKHWQITNVNDSQTFTAARECTIYRHTVNGVEVP